MKIRRCFPCQHFHFTPVCLPLKLASKTVNKLLSNKKRPTLIVSLLIDPTNIAKEFSTGYLLGELLNRHGLQEDFSMFSQNT